MVSDDGLLELASGVSSDSKCAAVPTLMQITLTFSAAKLASPCRIIPDADRVRLTTVISLSPQTGSADYPAYEVVSRALRHCPRCTSYALTFLLVGEPQESNVGYRDIMWA